MKKSEFLAYYLSLFDPNPECYAFRDTWEIVDKQSGEVKEKVAYIPSNYEGPNESTRQKVAEVVRRVGTSHLNPISLEAHLSGEIFLGAYPVHPDTNTCKFFCLDFDGKSGDPWSETMEAYEIFREEAGLPVYVERSQSGNGYHLYGFFEELVSAATIRRAIKPFIVKSETFDRLYPLQSSLSAIKPLGNLLALPLAGQRVAEKKSVFVEPVQRDGVWIAEEIEKQSDFLVSIQRISTETIEQLAKNAPELPEERMIQAREGAAEGTLPGVRKLVDPRFGCEWVRWQVDNPEDVSEPEWFALAMQLAQFRGGREVFHEISALSVRYDPRDCDYKFDHAVELNAPATCQTLRENFNGPECSCDKRFPGRVTHPYDLGSIPILDLAHSVDSAAVIEDPLRGLEGAIEWAMAVEADPTLGIGIPTGLSSVDEHWGFRKSTLTILAGLPGGGKTAYSLNWAYSLALRGIPVYYFSLEMSKAQLWIRLLCLAAGVDGKKLRKGELTAEDWRAIRAAEKRIRELPYFPLFIDDVHRDIRQITEVAWDLQEEHGPGVIIGDYLGLLDWDPGEGEYAALTRNSKSSKFMARILDCPVVWLHQFNRSAEAGEMDAQTFFSWLHGSSQLEKDSDTIWFILGESGPGIKERMLVKQKDRDGEAGIRIPLEFNQPLMQFGDQGTWLYLAGSQASFGDADLGDESTLPWEGLE